MSKPKKETKENAQDKGKVLGVPGLKGEAGVTNVSGVANTSKSSQPSFATQLVYWTVFFGAVSIAAFVFGERYFDLAEYNKDLIDEIVDDSNVWYSSAASLENNQVLGVTDENTADSSDSTEDDSESNGLDSVNDLLGVDDGEVVAQADDGTDEIVDDIQEERKQKLRDILKLQLPDETDNPNYPVTFVDPTEDGVEIQIDGAGFEKKSSPFLLPSLAIGRHTINFKFKDEDGLSQNLEEKIIVVPRAPVVSDNQNDKFRSDENVVFEGTAFPGSKVIFFISSDVFTTETDVDADGFWTLELREELDKGDHTMVAMVRVDGYASNFSEPFSFSVGLVSGDVSTEGIDEIVDEGGSFSWEDITNSDYYYYYLAGAGAVCLILLYFIAKGISGLIFKKKSSEVQDKLKNGGDSKKDEVKPTLSLREKFASAGLLVGAGEKPSKGSSQKKEDDSKKKSKKKKKGKKKKAESKDIKETPKTPEENEPEEKDKEADKPESTEGPKEPAEPKKPESPKEEGKPQKGKVYSKDEFLKKFEKDTKPASPETKEEAEETEEKEKPQNQETDSDDSNKISITLTSK